MKQVKQVLDLSVKTLDERGFPQARKLAEQMLTFVLDMSRLDLYMNFDRPLDAKEMQECRDYFKRVAQYEPPAYIEGSLEFFGRKFAVSKDVLIPRQETEFLVEEVLKFTKGSQTVWDVCTGSGCIGLSLKGENSNLSITLSDLSESALGIAKKNAANLSLDVNFLQGDLLTPFKGRRADVIVCNPPYISDDEYRDLEPSVKNYEPKLALVASDSGLQCYKRLAEDLRKFLNPGGRLYLEMGSTQHEAIKRIFEAQGFSNFLLIKDLAGLPRHFMVENE